MLYEEREYIPRRDDQSGQALSDVCICRKGFVIGNSSVLSGDIIWLSDIIPLSTERAGGCVKPWEHQSLTSNTVREQTLPGGWSCCASLCRSFWMMDYSQSHFKPRSHMDVRHRGFMRTKEVIRAKWNAELNGKGKGMQEMWWELRIPCRGGLACFERCRDNSKQEVGTSH